MKERCEAEFMKVGDNTHYGIVERVTTEGEYTTIVFRSTAESLGEPVVKGTPKVKTTFRNTQELTFWEK